MKLRRSSQGFTLIELLVVISIIAILASLAVPASIGVVKKANQMKDLNNAKQIYLGLKMYASDNDGVFPTKVVDSTGNVTAADITTSNQAYQNLFPQYISQEKIFYIAKSAWCNTVPPDEQITNGNALVGGENGYAYVTHLTDTSNPGFPLVADGFNDAITGKYATVETDKGGVWGGTVACVVRVDGSGKLEKVNSTTQLVMGPTGQAANANIFVASAGWLGATQLPVNPDAPTK